MAHRSMIPDVVVQFVGRDGLRRALFTDGTVLPVISGGDGDAPDLSELEGLSDDELSFLRDLAGDPPGGPTEPPPDGGDDVVPPDLSAAGKKALDEERKARRDAERQLRRMKADLEKARKDAMSEQERAITEAREEGEKTAEERLQSRIFLAEVRSAASGVLDPKLFKTPEVAKGLLDFKELPVTEEGDIDSEAISEAIKRLVGDHPHLKVSGSPGRSGSDIDQGARGDKPVQLTRSQLEDMSPEEITKALDEGRLDAALKGKS